MRWLEGRSLGPGWQKAPFTLRDIGSGLDWKSLRLDLDGEELIWSYDGNGLKFEVPQLSASGKRSLNVFVNDNSGRNMQISRTVQVLSGTGINWAHIVPNPIRGSSAALHYFLAGPIRSGFVKVYDSSGARVYQEELNSNPGRNQWNWELINSDGEELSNGVYFFKLDVRQNSREVRRKGKFVILR